MKRWQPSARKAQARQARAKTDEVASAELVERASAVTLSEGPVLMLWTAPPPARECHRSGRC